MFLGPADAVNVQPAAAHQVHPEVCRHQDHIHPHCFPRTSHRCKWGVNKYLVFIVFFKKSIKNYFADSLMIFFLLYSTCNHLQLFFNSSKQSCFPYLLYSSSCLKMRLPSHPWDYHIYYTMNRPALREILRIGTKAGPASASLRANIAPPHIPSTCNVNFAFVGFVDKKYYQVQSIL